MVGLPARGKSYIVTKLVRYLKWTGFQIKVFNVGSHRRKMGMQSAGANFFDASNSDGKKVREDLAMAVQDDMYSWLKTTSLSGRVAVFDATNTTKERRAALMEKAKEENSFLLFIESICDDKETLERNYTLKLENEDYKGMDPEAARADFMRRVTAYEKVYETIEDSEDGGEIAYIKLINVGQKVITHRCGGYIPSQIAFYLQNVHIEPHKILLSLPAESVDQGDDSYNAVTSLHAGVLTDAGDVYAQDLAHVHTPYLPLYLLSSPLTSHALFSTSSRSTMRSWSRERRRCFFWRAPPRCTSPPHSICSSATPASTRRS